MSKISSIWGSSSISQLFKGDLWGPRTTMAWYFCTVYPHFNKDVPNPVEWVEDQIRIPRAYVKIRMERDNWFIGACFSNNNMIETTILHWMISLCNPVNISNIFNKESWFDRSLLGYLDEEVSNMKYEMFTNYLFYNAVKALGLIDQHTKKFDLSLIWKDWQSGD